jgi:ribosome biogenesis GTPase
MSYEFRKHWPKLKHKFNKREKKKNKKLDLKLQKIKQKNMIDKQGIKSWDEQRLKWEDINFSWEDVVIDNSIVLLEWVVARKKWKVFNILNKKTENFVSAVLQDDVPSHLRNDFVVWDIVLYKEDDNNFVIQKRNNRINYLSKTRSNTSRFGSQREQIIASNIDVAVIVMPIKQPEFDHKLLDRYLVLCHSRWVIPVVCVNKIDLTNDRNLLLSQYKKSWITIIELSVKENKWIDKLKKELKNKTTVLLWKSWVGKTSIINVLCPEKDLLTQAVNQKSGEGRHTTTSSSLYLWDKKSYIIDTPGVRALWLDQISKMELKDLFPEFLKYKWKCKYSKCIHDIEPDCAIKKAVADWEIDQFRYDSYLRILGDLV